MNIDVSGRQHFLPTLSFMFSFFLLWHRIELAALPSLCSGHSLMPNAFHFMALHLIAAASVYVPNGSITAFDVLKTGSLQPESRSFHKYLNKLGTIRNILELWDVEIVFEMRIISFAIGTPDMQQWSFYWATKGTHPLFLLFFFFWSSHCLQWFSYEIILFFLNGFSPLLHYHTKMFQLHFFWHNWFWGPVCLPGWIFLCVGDVCL